MRSSPTGSEGSTRSSANRSWITSRSTMVAEGRSAIERLYDRECHRRLTDRLCSCARGCRARKQEVNIAHRLQFSNAIGALSVNEKSPMKLTRTRFMKTHHVRLPKGLMLFLLVLASTLNLMAEGQKLYLPALGTGNGAELGLALSNPALSEATVTLTARGLDGRTIAGQDISNPAVVRIPASGQRALRHTEIFGPGISGKAGWVELVSSTPAIKGYFMLFDAGLDYID